LGVSGQPPSPPQSRGNRHSGDKGCITGDSEEICIVTVDPPAKIFPQFQGKWFPDAFANAMCHFIDALEAGKPFWCSGRDNLNAVAIAEAAYRSVAERREIRRDELLGGSE